MQTEVRHLDAPENPLLPFPKLMINEGGNLIVLFTSKKDGCVLVDTSGERGVGDFVEGWNVNVFADLPRNVEVVLSNKMRDKE